MIFEAVWQVVSGECGVLAAIKPGKSFVDMSSVEVETAVELYEASWLKISDSVVAYVA